MNRRWSQRLTGRVRNSYKLQRLRALVSWAMEWRVRPFLLQACVRHVYGPTELRYGEEELVALCVVRNGTLHVRSFLDHHLSLGVKHVVLLDNGSTDDTVELARRVGRVTILRTGLPYRTYETVMKRYLVRRFCAERWSLTVDIDERFDYPFSKAMDVGGLLSYLNDRGYTAVLAQTLDCFADGPLRDLKDLDGVPRQSLEARYPYYDTSMVEAHVYRFGTPANPAIKMHAGGIRKSIFGTENGLTKASLIRLTGGLVPFVGFHQSANSAIADFSGALLHYPFAGDFREKVEEAVLTDRYRVSAAGEYRAYWARLKDDPELSLRRPTARRFVGVDALLDEGFLVVSPEYRRWVETYAAERTRHGEPPPRP